MSATKSLPNNAQKNGQKTTQKNVMPFTAKIKKKIEKTIMLGIKYGGLKINQNVPLTKPSAAQPYFNVPQAG